MASPLGNNSWLLTAVTVSSIGFLSVAVLLCLMLAARRVWRNQIHQKRLSQQGIFESLVSDVINSDYAPADLASLRLPPCHITYMTRVFLHHFRTLRGESLEKLRDLISAQNLEDRIVKATQNERVRGRRMQAVQTLSYLTTQSSLQIIYDCLENEDRYVRLTAARGLTRRDAQIYAGDIVASLSQTFPDEPMVLAGILSDFGREITPRLERIIKNCDDRYAQIACLEALVMIAPPETKLDLCELMKSKHARVRAAALSLSAISSHNSKGDPLMTGLADPATSVKIRAAKMAHDIGRIDVVSHLFKLAQDPVLWVRYWSLKAIWQTGQTGQTLVKSMGEKDGLGGQMAANVALEFQSGHV